MKTKNKKKKAAASANAAAGINLSAKLWNKSMNEMIEMFNAAGS